MSHTFGAHTTAEEAGAALSDQIEGKVVLITGCTWGGLGAEAARVIAKNGAKRIILASRTQKSIDETIQHIKEEIPSANLVPLVLNLADLKSVRQAAAEVNAYTEPIEVLINNAGVMASPYFKTADGFEGQIGTNHLGPFLFTNLVLPRMLTCKEPRIVNVSSSGHHFAPIIFSDIHFSNGEKYNKWIGYGQSKTANILFAKELSNRYNNKGLLAYSLHPGSINTNLQRHINREKEMSELMLDYEGNNVLTEHWVKTFASRKTLGEGAATTIVAAFDPSIKSQSGLFLHNAQIDNDAVKSYAVDDTNAKKLWDVSEGLVGEKFPVV
jgi:NAD(P)-dependent dehydrogenase (short-subunit alcohol dehydrogenase family)